MSNETLAFIQIALLVASVLMVIYMQLELKETQSKNKTLMQQNALLQNENETLAQKVSDLSSSITDLQEENQRFQNLSEDLQRKENDLQRREGVLQGVGYKINELKLLEAALIKEKSKTLSVQKQYELVITELKKNISALNIEKQKKQELQQAVMKSEAIQQRLRKQRFAMKCALGNFICLHQYSQDIEKRILDKILETQTTVRRLITREPEILETQKENNHDPITLWKNIEPMIREGKT